MDWYYYLGLIFMIWFVIGVCYAYREIVGFGNWSKWKYERDMKYWSEKEKEEDMDFGFYVVDEEEDDDTTRIEDKE